MTCKVPLVLHSLYFLYHTHNTSLLIDEHGPDKLSCYIPAAPIIKIDVCYMTDVNTLCYNLSTGAKWSGAVRLGAKSRVIYIFE